MTTEAMFAAMGRSIATKTTLNAYIGRLRLLLQRLQLDNTPHGLHQLLTNPDEYVPKIKRMYGTKTPTTRNMINAVLAVFKHGGLDDSFAAARAEWQKPNVVIYQAEMARYETNRGTKKQRDNFISLDDMRTKFEKIRRTEDPHKTLESSLHFCVLALYLNIRPRRSDFGEVKIYTHNPRGGESQKNYLVLRKGNSYFVLNDVSKVRANSSKDMLERVKHEPVKDELYRVIKDSLIAHPREYLFVGKRGNPLTIKARYSALVLEAFRALFGKNIGVTMLRHIFISNMDLNKVSVQQRNEIAMAMGHSRNMQDVYRMNVDDDA